jgi:phosphoribosylformylglycinamidine synthase subunit PurQ / glutaminase
MSEATFLVLKDAGINCEVESARAVRMAGGAAEIVHVSQLESGERKLSDYQGLFIPGGFSEGDAVRAGVILALRLKRGQIGNDIQEFNAAGKPILGVCNGFQVLTEMGLLPGEDEGRWERSATLRPNVSGTFESRWVDLKVSRDTPSPFVPEHTELPRIRLPIANGEGRFTMADPAEIERLRHNGRVLMYYADAEGRPSMDPVHNPSGSMGAIAALCNRRGNVMGSMPHIERYVFDEHEPSYRRDDAETNPYGLVIMRSIVDYAAKL